VVSLSGFVPAPPAATASSSPACAGPSPEPTPSPPSAARRQGPDALASRLAQLEKLCQNRAADLRAPGQVLLKLTVRGFGVVLPD
jgi:hypothetical protein